VNGPVNGPVDGPVVRSPEGLPDAVVAMAERGPEWLRWVEGLSALRRGVLDEWSLRSDGEPQHGHCSLVQPVRTAAGRPAVLKLGYPDDESAHEHLALQHWHGAGAVRLLQADPRRQALLLERLHPESLTEVGDVEACETVAGLYRRLHRPALPQLRRLSGLLGRWQEQLAAVPRQAPVPHRLVQQAAGIARDFATDPATDGALLHGDLHYDNVLAGDREPWLVIDPKPLDGDPHYEPAPMLWNRWDEVVASGDVRDAVRRRFHTLVDVAGLDEDRARDWAVLRVVLNGVWELRDTPSGRPPDRHVLTVSVSVAKAVQG
jgi:streptomycin 6-kinase